MSVDTEHVPSWVADAPAPSPDRPSAGRRSRHRRGGRRRPALALPGLVAVVFVVLHVFAFPASLFSNDSYRYARQAYEYLGDSRPEAQHKALVAYCKDEANRRYRGQLLDEMKFRQPHDPQGHQRCMKSAEADGLKPNDPRYERIFETRPLYPLIAAPFVGLMGAKSGLSAVSLIFTTAGGFFLLAALRRIGLSPGLALLGQILYYATPLATWGTLPLAEGPLLAMLASMLYGAVCLLQGRVRTGAVVYAASLAVSAGVKYSSAQMVAVTMTAAAAAMLVWVRRTRHRGTWWLFGLSAGTAAVVAVTGKLLKLPGTSATLQDTFSKHWTRPEVATPWHDLLHLNHNFWWQWAQHQALAPVLVLPLALALWGLWRRSVPLALTVAGLGVTGIATVVAHPVTFQAERLYAAVWLIVAAGIPVLVDEVIRRAVHRRCGGPGHLPGHPPAGPLEASGAPAGTAGLRDSAPPPRVP
ncbi:hypothetical protein [Streptomyces sp. CT34]|uniref:hypothetical protein n=1 Tax=Streptomyces sp. CT34 TaxID=1553907 RepID=UPI00068F5628|nr:hypothetical protein [Streptomyces sp. CT34]